MNQSFYGVCATIKFNFPNFLKLIVNFKEMAKEKPFSRFVFLIRRKHVHGKLKGIFLSHLQLCFLGLFSSSLSWMEEN